MAPGIAQLAHVDSWTNEQCLIYFLLSFASTNYILNENFLIDVFFLCVLALSVGETTLSKKEGTLSRATAAAWSVSLFALVECVHLRLPENW